MKIISVIPLKKTILKGDLTYFTSLEIPAGNVVFVPIRKQKVLALVTSSDDLKDTKSNVKGMNFNLKKVTANLGPSIFLKEFLDSIFEACDYFIQNKTSAIASFVPNVFIEKYETLAKINPSLDDVEKNISANIKSEKLLLQYPFLDRISIYKTLVRESFARGKSVFLVLPTESDIVRFENLLSKGIEQFTFSLHGGIPAKKNLMTYEKIITPAHPVLIIGTAPFLSIPRNDIGTIILEHENSSAYKMIGRPYFDLRFFTELYASKIKAKFIMADEILRFETIGRMERDHLSMLHPLSYRIDFDGEIEISKNEEGQSKKEKKKFQIIKTESIEEINSALKEKKSVFIFSLRKGLATQTVCNDCGETVSCPECNAPLVLYLSHQGKKRMFACNRCEREMEGDVACASCQSWNLMPLGIGTDTVHEEAEKLFLKTPIFKLDKESAKTARGAHDIIKDFESIPGSILVGTEMTFFYLKDKVPLSVIASFDSLWSIPNFRMSEKIIQIILSTLSFTTDKLIIQTKNEQDAIIQAIKSGNLLPFVREELEDRKKLDYPPFKRFIKITYIGDKEQTLRARKFLEELLAEYSPEIFSGFVAKIKGKYITNALIKIEPVKWSLPEISAGGNIDQNLLNKLSSLPSLFEILVDPEDLL